MIKTYPKMNEAIKDIFGQSEEFSHQYAAARIVELEQALEFYAEKDVVKGKITWDNGYIARQARKGES